MKLNDFRAWLLSQEKSDATVEKYMRDVLKFCAFQGQRPLSREVVLAYKKALQGAGYQPTSVNSMLASVNAWLRHLGVPRLAVRQLRIQQAAYCPEEQELSRQEYFALIRAAKAQGDDRLALILQTVCATGIRISELAFITREAVEQGAARVRCKGKHRVIFLVSALQVRLLDYALQEGVEQGPLFVSGGGVPLDRSNIWRSMKALCATAGVAEKKVFPHNLRHLFAREYYEGEKDIAKLADILGHSSINTTRIYIKSSGSEHRRQLERMHLIPED